MLGHVERLKLQEGKKKMEWKKSKEGGKKGGSIGKKTGKKKMQSKMVEMKPNIRHYI